FPTRRSSDLGVRADACPRPDPGKLLTEGLRYAGRRVPHLHQGRGRLAEVEPAPGAAPGGHRAPGQAEGDGAVDDPAHLQLIAGAGKRLDEGDVRAVGREGEVGVV